MTKQEILDALEGLKDSTNHAGKQSIDGIKAGVRALLEPGPDIAVKPTPPILADTVQEEPWKPLNEPEAKRATPKAKPKKAVHSKSRK